jgi:hypothetical protein
MTITARWRECRTCPVCNHRGWCRASDDGRVACRRLVAGAVKTIKYKDGTEAFLHFTRGRPIDFGTPAPPKPAAGAGRAADADLHRVYHMLLACPELRLQARHRVQLLARGLTDQDLRRCGYSSLPPACRAGVLRRLRDHLPDELLLATPGVIRREGRRGPYLTLGGRAGLLVPVRSAAGLIVGLVVRPDEPQPGKKYMWFSSAWYGGPSPGSRVHVPAGVGPAPSVKLVEGTLKADVVFALSGEPVVGLPGPFVTGEAVSTLLTLGAKEALLALDADVRTNPAVARAQLHGLTTLKRAGFEYGIVRWPLDMGKGYDDLLLTLKKRAV